MKKILGLAVLTAGIWYFNKEKKPTTEPVDSNGDITAPIEFPVNEVSLYEGKIVVDAGGFWTYVLNGVLRPLSEKGLQQLNAKGVEIITIKTDFWTKYIQFAGAGY